MLKKINNHTIKIKLAEHFVCGELLINFIKEGLKRGYTGSTYIYKGEEKAVWLDLGKDKYINYYQMYVVMGNYLDN